jgi:lipopolysaccharide export system permease protein
MIIHRSIFKELLINFMVIIFSLSVILFMEKFVRLTKLIMGRGVEIIDIVKIFLYLQPSILLFSIPMAILIAIFLTYGRMNSDNEIVVLKGSGMSFLGISRAAIILSIAGFSVLLFLSLYLSPRSMYSFKQTLYETIIKKTSMTLEEETFSKVFKGTVIFIKDMPSENKFNGIFIYKDVDNSVNEPVVIVAEKGAITSNFEEGTIKLSMHNGVIHISKEKSSSEVTFAEYDFVLATGIEPIRQTKPSEIGTLNLWKGRKDKISWEIELNRRFAIPFACLIFGFLGPSLSNRMGKIGRLGGFSFSLSILILYYLFLMIGEGFAKADRLSPFLGGWGPNIFFGIITILFFYKAYKDKPIKKL